jgi:hypothetical protein
MDTGPAARKASRDKTRKGLADAFPFDMSPAAHRPGHEDHRQGLPVPATRSSGGRWMIAILGICVLAALVWGGFWMFGGK